MNSMKTYIQMGYTQRQVQQAFRLVQSNGMEIFDALQLIQQQDSPTKNSSQKQTRTFLSGIESLKTKEYERVFCKETDKNNKMVKHEVRQEWSPVGLLNVSNCCYLNSLLQCYFLMGDFVTQVMTAQPLQNIQKTTDSKIKLKRLQNEYKLLSTLKEIFYRMAISSRKYIDPTNVLKNLVDSVGQKISYGEQKDLFQINMQIIERLNQCLLHTKKYFQKSLIDPTPTSIKHLFYGTKVQFLDDSETTTDFMGIILNPTHNNLLKALDEELHYQVQVQGKWVKKHTYIRTQPQYFFFYINSLGYDRYDKIAVKNQDKFIFDFTIYIDRYLERYKQIDQVNSPTIQNLQSKKNLIINKLSHLEALRIKLQQCRAHASFFEGWIQKFPKKQQIDEMREQLKLQLLSIQSQLQKVQSRKEKYQLMYIFVHRGNASSGHYWGYGRNNAAWIRFDINSKKILQQQLFEEIQKTGGTIYALVYSKPTKIPQINYQYYLESNSQQKNNYLKFIPENIINEICIQNKQLKLLETKKKENQLVENLLREYKIRLNITFQTLEEYSKKSKLKIPYYDNFTMYLYSIDEKQLAKYTIFQIALKIFSKMKTQDLISSQVLKKIQKYFTKKMKGNYMVRHYILSKQPKQYQKFKNIYKQFFTERICIKELSKLRTLIKDQTKTDQMIFKTLEDLSNFFQGNSYIQHIFRQIYTLIVLKVSKSMKISNKIVKKYLQNEPLIINQIKEFNGVSEEIDWQKEEQQMIIDWTGINYVWKIQDIKKNSENIAQKTSKIIAEILQSLQDELKIYRYILKQKKVIKKNQFQIHIEKKQQNQDQDKDKDQKKNIPYESLI